ncbi:segregation and condensation protein A [Sphingobium cupriresistens]|uniref:Segregation and condensation protein A n=2 Tax=Sphingobium cupriresistens TaxID=1132417 RepID=A0A0J7XVQ6_9SPHN|nr:ScpA family protein [Sphingobium cupriresistens]KMS55689.1 chromosome segregation and condensation protein ScpA [Sphingobium cupriresistens LL01]RYM10164.1 segregation/condensation protein A [Sphingobium cupriresistens]
MDDLFIAPAIPSPETLTVSFDAWEGPLDLLLSLARTQKVDLREISILALTEQYLDFIDGARELRLELAADYLVMAAWLAYLKSSLLLPRQEQADPSPEDLALRLQLRLQRLHAMRDAAARLMARDRVGRDVFTRRKPEGLRLVKKALWRASLYDLIQSYGQIRARTQPAVHIIAARPVMTLDEAIHRVGSLVGAALDWTRLESFLPPGLDAPRAKSALASSFVAALELARQGRLEMQQDGIFAPLYLRAATPNQEAVA